MDFETFSLGGSAAYHFMILNCYSIISGLVQYVSG